MTLLTNNAWRIALSDTASMLAVCGLKGQNRVAQGQGRDSDRSPG
jgi:hypothetical protein